MPSDVTFGTNQDAINPTFHVVLDDVAAVLAQYDRSTIDIVGHADSDGADAYNLDLSQRRASNVARYLIDRNILPARMYVEGRGESQPIASNATAAGKAQNRRVEIMIRPFTG
jgi:outer membrane protein OmpA-like peptidoglycan-associated protein